MSIWSGHRWHARVFLRTITPHQEPRIISTWWRSYSGTAAPWSPAATSSRSGTRGGDHVAAKRTRAGELLKQTNSVVPYRKGMHHTLSRLTTQVITPRDVRDDRLSPLLQHVRQPAS